MKYTIQVLCENTTNQKTSAGTLFKTLKPYSTTMHIRRGLILDRTLPANIQKGFPLASNNRLKNNPGAWAQRIELEWGLQIRVMARGAGHTASR